MTKASTLNHVGLTVTDIDQAIAFYTRILGFEHIAGPLDILPDDTHFGRLAIDVLDDRLKSGKFAHLVGENGAGLELFSFDDPEAGRREEMQYWKNGLYHMAVTTDDIDSMIKGIERSGGRRRTATWEIFPGSGRYLAYAEDPFGNPLELYTHDYRDTWRLAAEDQTVSTDDDPVTLVVELRAKEGAAADVFALTKALFPKALSEPTAKSIDLFEDPSDPQRLLLIEKWGSGAYVTSDAHTKSDHMSAYFEALTPLLADEPRWSVWSHEERHAA